MILREAEPVHTRNEKDLAVQVSLPLDLLEGRRGRFMARI
jgi:hypothetical protein